MTTVNPRRSSLFFFNDTATTEIYTLSLHDALPISHAREQKARGRSGRVLAGALADHGRKDDRSEEHTSELQSLRHLVCRLLLEKKKGGDGTLEFEWSCSDQAIAQLPNQIPYPQGAC